jgi:hypothetical protein
MQQVQQHSEQSEGNSKPHHINIGRQHPAGHHQVATPAGKPNKQNLGTQLVCTHDTFPACSAHTDT